MSLHYKKSTRKGAFFVILQVVFHCFDFVFFVHEKFSCECESVGVDVRRMAKRFTQVYHSHRTAKYHEFCNFTDTVVGHEFHFDVGLGKKLTKSVVAVENDIHGIGKFVRTVDKIAVFDDLFF